MSYSELSVEERATIQIGRTQGFSLRRIACLINRSPSTISRELGEGTAIDTAFTRNGHDIGDVELAARYQLNEGSARVPFFVGSLRFKSRTGRDPFEVVTDCVTTCSAAGTTGLPLELPTGLNSIASIRRGSSSEAAAMRGSLGSMGMGGRGWERVDQDWGDWGVTSGMPLRGARRKRTTRLLEAW